MNHRIEFRLPRVFNVEVPGKARMVRIIIKKGLRLRVHLKPYVLESDEGPLEVADLFLRDGSIARAVRFAAFQFLDEREDHRA